MDEYFRALGQLEGMVITMNNFVVALQLISEDPNIPEELTPSMMAQTLARTVEETLEDAEVNVERLRSLYISDEAEAAERPLGCRAILRDGSSWKKVGYNTWSSSDGFEDLTDSGMVDGLVVEDPLVDWIKYQ